MQLRFVHGASSQSPTKHPLNNLPLRGTCSPAFSCSSCQARASQWTLTFAEAQDMLNRIDDDDDHRSKINGPPLSEIGTGLDKVG